MSGTNRAENRMRVAVLLALGMLGGGPFICGISEAQENEVDRVHACATIVESTARLACFDAAVATLKQAQAAGDVSVVSRARMQQAEKDAFGLGSAAQASAVTSAVTGARSPDAGGALPAELGSITVSIVSAVKRPDGTHRFTLDNGQIWEQTDTVNLGLMPRGAISAEIRRAALGSFMLKPGNRPAVRVKRVK